MARSVNVNQSGTPRPIGRIWVNQGGTAREIGEGWVNQGGTARQFWPPEGAPPTGPDPGTYVLPPTSISLGDYSGYAEFDTIYYRGYISEIRARISWGGYGNYPRGVDISGRPSGNLYRNIYNDGEWDGRTIDHRIDTYDASSLTEFNSGAAYGFDVALNTGLILDINNIRLVLTVY
jgi:hypothetical protein